MLEYEGALSHVKCGRIFSAQTVQRVKSLGYIIYIHWVPTDRVHMLNNLPRYYFTND